MMKTKISPSPSPLPREIERKFHRVNPLPPAADHVLYLVAGHEGGGIVGSTYSKKAMAKIYLVFSLLLSPPLRGGRGWRSAQICVPLDLFKPRDLHPDKGHFRDIFF